MFTPAEDAELRREAMVFLTLVTEDGQRPVRREHLKDFRFNGQPVRLIQQQGIIKPAQCHAAVSIRTAYRPEGKARPYADEIGPDGLITYKWQGTDGAKWDNRALRLAGELGLPLIWFYGVAPALYQAVFPVFVVDERPDAHEFVISPVEMPQLLGNDSPAESVARRYLAVESRRRLHQPIFRSMVLEAYAGQCAICSLRHRPLIDAAHIIPDSDARGVASVRNGLALCRIHHGAYDAKILGISPDYRVGIRADILDEVDGPMLEHGLKALHGQPLRVVPRARSQRPDPSLLGERYEAFTTQKTAG